VRKCRRKNLRPNRPLKKSENMSMMRDIRIQVPGAANLSCGIRSNFESMLRIDPLQKPFSAAC
jgi:hypothetical protein